MDKSQKEYVVQGKVMHVADMNNYPFCEIGLITGTSKSNAVLNVWNTTSAGDCPPDKFDPILADKGERIKKATGAREVWLNPRRHWTFNEIWAYEVGNVRDFEGVQALWMGVVGAEVAAEAVGGGHYHPGNIVAHRAFKFNTGSTVYLLDMPDGKVLVMQSWTDHFNKGGDRREPQGSWQPVQALAARVEVPSEGARQRSDHRAQGAALLWVGDAGRVPEHLSGLWVRYRLQLRPIRARAGSATLCVRPAVT